MRAVALGMVLLCGIAQGAEPPDADRSVGEDRKAAVVAQAKQQVVELEKQRVAAVKSRNRGLISALVNDIRLAKIELEIALEKTVEDYAKEADAEAKEAAQKADTEAKTVTNTIGMKLIEIPAGTFTMGNGGGVKVTLTKPFRLGKTEVTQGQFNEVMAKAPWRRTDGAFVLMRVELGKDNAASYVSWDDATAFCETLTDLERKAGKLPAGESYRLPTEAEWEYACRAGTTTDYSFADARKGDQYAWFDGNASKAGEFYAHKVGMKKPNPWGLHDMHGNVYEWCSDMYGHEEPSGGVDPVGFKGVLDRVLDASGTWWTKADLYPHCSSRVFRGGSWGHPPGYCGSAIRNIRNMAHDYYLGFRVARSQSAQ